MQTLSKTVEKILRLVNDHGPIDARSIWLELGDDYELDTVELQVLRCKRKHLMELMGKCRRKTDTPRYVLTDIGRFALTGVEPDFSEWANEVVAHAKANVPNSVFAWASR